MFAQFQGAIALAQFTDLNNLAHTLWKAHAAGVLDDDAAQTLAEAVQKRRGQGVSRSMGAFRNAPTGSVRARAQRSPDKIASIERRRRLARSSPVPPDLVDRFTQGEHAVITVVAGEMQRAGACTWCIAKIAAMAGVCDTLVRDALRKARNVGLLFSIERRRRGQKSLTNIVRVLRRSWGAWLQRIGCRKKQSTSNKIQTRANSGGLGETEKRSSGIEFANLVPSDP